MAIFDFKTGQPITPTPAPQAKPAKAAKSHVPARRKRGTEKDEKRKSMLAKVHLAKKQLGLDDDVYRYLLQERFSVDSSAKLNPEQLHHLLLHFQCLGVQFSKGSHRDSRPRKKSIPAVLTHDNTHEGRVAVARKIEALLAEKGRVEGTHMPWEYAVGILKRQTRGRIKSLDQADYQQLEAVMLALHRDAQRHGRYTESWSSQ